MTKVIETIKKCFEKHPNISSIATVCIILLIMVIAYLIFSPDDNYTSENVNADTKQTTSTADTNSAKQIDYDNLISVVGIVTSVPNSAGGVDINVRWDIISNKDIKYVTFTVAAYNAVDDTVYCEISGNNTANLKLTGPCQSGYSSYVIPETYKSGITSKKYVDNVRLENVWYNKTIEYAKLISVKIEFMDGEIVFVDKDNISKIENFDI